MDKRIEGTCADIFGDLSLRRQAEDLALKYGIRADLNGCDYLVDAAMLFRHGARGFSAIYAAVGRYRGIKPKTVMRDISYAVEKAFDIAERLSKILGIKIPPSEIHGGLVIGYIGRALSLQYKEASK